jgi:hypothetical protein
MKSLSLIAFSVLLPALLTACATPVRSTVEGYGEGSLQKSDPLYFDREGIPLAERPVADACKKAARDAAIPVQEAPCSACKRVQVRSRLAGTTSELSSGPGFGTSVGFGGGGTGLGIGFGSGGIRSRPQTERVIEIGIFDANEKEPRHIVSVRSLGRDNSVSAVAYEMCVAAFRDYPANLKGKEYAISP